jgi:hypothetical protein
VEYIVREYRDQSVDDNVILKLEKLTKGYRKYHKDLHTPTKINGMVKTGVIRGEEHLTWV